MKTTKSGESAPMPVPGTRVLFAGLAARLDRVTPEITARIRAEIPGYSALPPEEHAADVDRQIRDAVSSLLSGAGPTASAIEHARAMGHRRAAAGMTLPDVIEAYHIAYREIWTELLRDARISIERLRLEPLRHLAGDLAERRLLQGFGGYLAAQLLLPADTKCLESLGLLALLLARRSELGEQCLEVGRRLPAGIAGEIRLLRQRLQRNDGLERRATVQGCRARLGQDIERCRPRIGTAAKTD